MCVVQGKEGNRNYKHTIEKIGRLMKKIRECFIAPQRFVANSPLLIDDSFVFGQFSRLWRCLYWDWNNAIHSFCRCCGCCCKQNVKKKKTSVGKTNSCGMKLHKI